MKKYKFEMIATECLQIEVEADTYEKAEEIAGKSCFDEDWESTDWLGGEICSVDLPEDIEEFRRTHEI
jgi:hypothetical protein